MKSYHLTKRQGIWTLRDMEAGRDRPFGILAKEEAIRRSAAFLRMRAGKSCLRIFSTKGKVQSERIYEGRPHLN